MCVSVRMCVCVYVRVRALLTPYLFFSPQHSPFIASRSLFCCGQSPAKLQDQEKSFHDAQRKNKVLPCNLRANSHDAVDSSFKLHEIYSFRLPRLIHLHRRLLLHNTNKCAHTPQEASEELQRIQAERRDLFLTAFERVAAEISGTFYFQYTFWINVRRPTRPNTEP